jgi:aerobic-type carbon monoxide dehydrogenase small subunit (CoxS/CutS family)
VGQERVHLDVNGRQHQIEIEPNRLLLDVLRQDLNMTGTKRGCDDSSCGACTVLIDDEPQMSCLMLAVSYQDCRITTIEGLARNGELQPLQQGFIREGGAQCGFCTPGMILTAKSLLDRNPEPTDDDIREAISGNLCRCTGYTQIMASIRRAIGLLKDRQLAEAHL